MTTNDEFKCVSCSEFKSLIKAIEEQNELMKKQNEMLNCVNSAVYAVKDSVDNAHDNRSILSRFRNRFRSKDSAYAVS